MAGLSTYYENAIINHMLRNQAFTPPSLIYLALFTAAPSDDGGGTEVSGGSYARQSFTLSAPSSGTTVNNNLITFPTATANWGTITHVAIFDAATAGNMLMWGPLTTPITVNSGQQILFETGQLSFTLD